jgi:hypothetical protein
LLMPADAFVPEVADIWVEQIDNIEIAELTVMNLFQHLSYAPALSFKWIADEREFVQTCGFLLVARLLMKKGDMADRPADEFLDQALSGALSDKYNVRQAALLSLRKYMQHDEEHRFRVCRMVENFQQSTDENELALYQMVRNQINE